MDSYQPPGPKDEAGSAESSRATEGVGGIGWSKGGEGVRMDGRRGTPSTEIRRSRKQRQGENEDAKGMDNSDSETELRARDPAPGFSSARSQGFWGPLPPGSPPLPSPAGRGSLAPFWALVSWLQTSISAAGSPPEFLEGAGGEWGGEGRARKGRPSPRGRADHTP